MSAENTLVLKGKLISEIIIKREKINLGSNPSYVYFFIEVKRKTGNKSDILQVYMSLDLYNHTNLKIGTSIRVSGEVITRNYGERYTEGAIRTKLDVFVLANSLEVIEDDNFNDGMLIGNLCKCPIFKETSDGKQLSEIILAINKNMNGVKHSSYIPCVLWGGGSMLARRIKIGDKLKLYGYLQSRGYTKNDENMVAYEFSCYSSSVIL